MTAYGDGLYGDSTYGGAPPAISPVALAHIREKPPLRLHIDAITPAGRHYRWSGTEPDPANVFSGLRHSSTMPGGYETMDCELPRKPGIDYDDLERLSTLNIYGPGVAKAGEYRLERAPRTSGDKMSVSPAAAGWQAHLDDDKSAQMIYVDRDLGRWQGPTNQRQLDLVAGDYTPGGPDVAQDAATPALKLAQTAAWAATGRPHLVASYDAQGCDLGRLYYAWTRGANINAADTNWLWEARLWDTATSGGGDESGNLRAAGPGTGTLDATTDTRRFIELVLAYTGGAAGADNVEHALMWTCLAAYGNHGLTRRGENSATDAQGLYASDIVAHAVATFAPLLTLVEGDGGTIQPSGFVIPHLAFLEPTTAAEIVRGATKFGLQDWGVWDNKTFWWGATGKRWRARIGPAQLEETGPQLERLWNSITVSYTDVDGTTKTVGPVGSGADTEDAALEDDDPSNPANQLGITRREVLSMGTSTAAGAIEVGRRFLEQSALLDRSGRATLVGHVEDDRGVLRPYWQVRAGDTISFLDAADTSERKIVRVEHSYDTRSCSIDLDAPPDSMAALLERLGVSLVSLGI